MKGRFPVATAIPLRRPEDAARVMLIGPPGPLRSAIAEQLRARTTLLACLDLPGYLEHIPSGHLSHARLTGAAVVFLTVPRPPRLASRLCRRYREPRLIAAFEQAAATAWHQGAARLVVVSTVFRYHRDQGRSLTSGSPTQTAAEIASATAAERAASLFTCLGGDSVILRLGWAYSRDDCITSTVLAAARRGWRLIDGDPDAWLAMIAQPDAARAVLPALTVASGTYNVTSGRPVTQATLNARLAAAAGKNLAPLDDPHWGDHGILFGHSRMIIDGTFCDLTGWRPQIRGSADNIASMLSGIMH